MAERSGLTEKTFSANEAPLNARRAALQKAVETLGPDRCGVIVK
jgi:hypothetical protein